MAETVHERRTRRAQERLDAVGGDALVLFPSRNLQYLTGFYEEPGERLLLLVVPVDGHPVALVPDLYADQVRETWLSDVRTWSDGDDSREALAAVLADCGLEADASLFVDDTMHARFTLDLRAVAPAATVSLAGAVLGPLRVRKDETELAAMREAAAVADRVLEDVRAVGADAVGTTESELAWEIERRLREAGAEGLAFPVLVGSGPNGASPHHTHGDRVVEPGDPVVLDLGARVDGYLSDQTRTVVFGGDPPAEFERVHETVRAAQQAGVEAVEPGASAAAVDAAAREVVEDAGYGDAFIHRTGHGVGLEVHEEPYVVAGADRDLEPGMTFSVEPGVYLPGEFGVRVEDLVVVTETGCDRLNHTDRGWRA
jgi:Xaa-Pro aminopeptidase